MKALGIDTSCYTTSLALIDDSGLLADRREVLRVPPQHRGLQQSKAVFQHINNLPRLLEGMQEMLHGIRCVGVSACPRMLAGSYMPVFEVGLGHARSIAAALGVPLHTFSHQQGHIAAALWGQPNRPRDVFLALHVSGGTTELLHARPLGSTYDTTIVGQTSDLNAGQFVDRIGIAMGLAFPAGAALEKLAQQAQGDIPRLPVSVKGTTCSFSGSETTAQRMLSAGATPSAMARAVEDCIAATLIQMVAHQLKQEPYCALLLAGGVLSNAYIRGKLRAYFEQHHAIRVLLAAQGLASDNAVGVAAMAYHKQGGTL